MRRKSVRSGACPDPEELDTGRLGAVGGGTYITWSLFYEAVIRTERLLSR